MKVPKAADSYSSWLISELKTRIDSHKKNKANAPEMIEKNIYGRIDELKRVIELIERNPSTAYEKP